ncbi:MAG: hypothetical protein M1821_007663 [Bathelium mastoideum]|nr:MAG: hypothetical protein M1821_007663 [Bathelium mastoideum]
MFMLRNVSKYLFGDTSTETLLTLPQGQLYLVRPLSPKGYSELIFKDAAASIRRTGQEFQYQLVVQRVYEEGEEALTAEDDDDDAALDENLSSDKDEKGFLLDPSLRLRCDLRDGGAATVLAWRDLSGDPGDLFEFVCDGAASTSAAETAQFVLVAQQCQFERKYRKPATTATEAALREFEFTDDEPIPDASPIASPRTLSPTGTQSLSAPKSLHLIEANSGGNRGDMARKNTENTDAKAVAKREDNTALTKKEGKATVAPVSAKAPKSLEVLAHETAELHLFDFNSGTFVLQDAEVEATVSEIGNWNYWLQIVGDKGDWLGQAVVPELNPVFNFEYLSFIFNHYPEDGSAYSWLLRFKDSSHLEKFQEGLMQALWEHLNETKWLKTKEVERDYVLESFKDLTMDDIREEEAKEEDEEAEEAEQEEEEEEDEEPAQREEDYDEDEDEDEVVTRDEDGNINSQLAVGSKHDRSFVVRGSKIGVFKHTPGNQLEFTTNISKVQTPKGKLFSPKKVMLHEGDRNMVLQNADNPNSLYRMDLEYGKVVDEWKVHDDIPVNVFTPENKFAQMTDEKTFLGLSNNALYRIDPRLAGTKLVPSELKQYASKNAFSAAATTEQGYIAVASSKGDVRMFDRLGINAKTHIPALGDAILGLDVSADGRWLLATTRTYLLLIDALQKEGSKNAGKLGFEKPFAADAKPQPRRLALTPAHVAQFQHETGAPLAFAPARFNVNPSATGTSGETTIVSATGPFVVTWSLDKVLAGRRDPYSIRRYTESVQADDFKFGSDRSLIVALPNEVEAVRRSMLKRPTRESIAGMAATPRRSGGGRSSSGRGTRGSYLGKGDIVNSPY